MHCDAKKITVLEIRVESNLCAKLETDRSRPGAPWATEIYLPPPLLDRSSWTSGINFSTRPHDKRNDLDYTITT